MIHGPRIVVRTVIQYNQTVKPDANGFYAWFRNSWGMARRTGYVASCGDSHFWAPTKKGAMQRLLQSIANREEIPS